MKKVLLLAAVALVAAPAASAKELLGVQVCGSDGCATDKGAQILGPRGPFDNGGATLAPAKPGKWFRVYGLVGDRGRIAGKIQFWYVPDGKLLVSPGGGGQTTAWQRADARWQAALDRLTAKVKPFPAPTLTAVRVDGKAVSDPQSYLALYTIGSKAETYPRDPTMVEITFESKSPTPWTYGNYFALYPKANLLVRDGQIVSLPHDVATRAASGLSLDAGRAFPWISLLAGLAVIALVLVCTWLATRVPARPQPVPQA